MHILVLGPYIINITAWNFYKIILICIKTAVHAPKKHSRLAYTVGQVTIPNFFLVLLFKFMCYFKA